MSEQEVVSEESVVTREPKPKSWLPMVVIAALGAGGLGGHFAQMNATKQEHEKALTVKANEFKKEKDRLIKEQAERILSITQVNRDTRAKEAAIKPIDALLAGNKVTVRYTDGTGAKQELKDVPLAKESMPTPMPGNIPVVPMSPPTAPTVKPGGGPQDIPPMPWLAKEKGYIATIAKLNKELVAANQKLKEAMPEVKPGSAGWAKVGELEGANVVHTPFEKGLTSIDPDPATKFTLSESRDVFTLSEGGKFAGILRPGRVVTIRQVKVIQGGVFALVQAQN